MDLKTESRAKRLFWCDFAGTNMGAFYANFYGEPNLDIKKKKKTTCPECGHEW